MAITAGRLRQRHREILTNIFHTLSVGELAVNGFFLLSGYLILQSWQRQPQFTSFLKKRILRIYPGFIVASLVSMFMVTPLGIHLIDFWRRVDLLAHLQDLLCLNTPSAPPNIFEGDPYPKVNSSMWTIVGISSRNPACDSGSDLRCRCDDLVASLAVLTDGLTLFDSPIDGGS
jgi:hypothetical protein